MTKKISQREAVRLKKKVRELEEKFERIRNGWDGVRIDTWNLSDTQFARVKTAQLLGRTTVVIPDWTGNEVNLRAVQL